MKNIIIPDMGGANDADVIEVLVKPGDKVKIDTPLISLESDKATMEVPSSDEGVIKELKIKVGDKVKSGDVILTLETSGKTVEAVSNVGASGARSAENDKKAEVNNVGATGGRPTANQENSAPVENQLTDDSTHAGPAVRKLAKEFGVDLSKIHGSGPKNRIIMSDVQAFVKSRLSSGSVSGLPEAPVVDFGKFGETEIQALSRIKKVSGKNLHRNWVLIPHITQFGEADISELEAFRQAQKSELERQGVKLTPLIFIMKAVVAALKAFPHFNASLDSNGENLILKKYFHIGVAVDTPDGLVVPVIRDVDKKGLTDLAKELSIVSEKARNKQLTPNEMQGGCFSISSLGGIGGTAFTPIVNMPEVAILGVSKSSYKPVYQENGKFVPRLMLPLSLSYDHRVIDGADGARFIVYLANMLADIRGLLL